MSSSYTRIDCGRYFDEKNKIVTSTFRVFPATTTPLSVHLFQAIMERDGLRAGRLMLERSKEQDCADPEAFCRGIASIVDAIVPPPPAANAAPAPPLTTTTGLRLSVVQVSQILGGVLGLCCAHRVLLEANFAAVVAAIGVLEGLGRSLSPDLDILTEARPIILGAVLNKGLGLGSRDRPATSSEASSKGQATTSQAEADVDDKSNGGGGGGLFAK